MAHVSLNAAMLEATPAACRALIAQGINFTVAVENQRGKWFLLHAEDIAHAINLAHNWVDVLNARGASIWRLNEDGPAGRHCGLIQPDYHFA
jgi:hypothetical protein